MSKYITDNGSQFSYCQRMECKYVKLENKHESCDKLELEVLELEDFNKYKHRCKYL